MRECVWPVLFKWKQILRFNLKIPVNIVVTLDLFTFMLHSTSSSKNNIIKTIHLFWLNFFLMQCIVFVIWKPLETSHESMKKFNGTSKELSFNEQIALCVSASVCYKRTWNKQASKQINNYKTLILMRIVHTGRTF